MTLVVAELYNALRSAGVADDVAQNAARAVIGNELVATKADVAALRSEIVQLRGELRTEMADLESRLLKWNVGTLLALAGLVFTIARWV